MLFVDGIGSRLRDVIFVRYDDQELDTTIAEEYHGEWRRDVPETLDEPPPPDLREPGKSFRKLWSQNADVRNTLGWATGPEQRGDVWIQDFVTGRMFFPLDQGTVYLQQSGQMIEVPYIAELP
jgi:hypothetical protein